MTIKEYIELLKYISENNSWRNMYDVSCVNKRNAIKYVDCSFDTRGFNIWRVEFRGCTDTGDMYFRLGDFEGGSSLKDIYEWLDKKRK